MAAASIELPDGGASWAGRQKMIGALRRLGYDGRPSGAGERWVILVAAG